MSRRPSVRSLMAAHAAHSCSRRPGRSNSAVRRVCGIQFVTAALPSRVVVAVAVSPRVLWIIIDPAKPNAREHLVDLLEHWPTPHPDDDLRLVFFEAGFHVGVAQCPDPNPPEQGS